MENFDVMQRFEASDYLNEDFPDVVFLDILLILLMSCDFLEKITVIRVFHHNTVYQKIRG
jgi:two-component SAPR family response regulator